MFRYNKVLISALIIISLLLFVLNFIFIENAAISLDENQIFFGTNLRDTDGLFETSLEIRRLAREANIKIIRQIYDVSYFDPNSLTNVVKQIRSIGAEPLICLPMSKGYTGGIDPVEVSVEIVTKLGPKCRLYEVGNEPQNPFKNISPELYARIFRDIVVACRKVNPTAYYGGPTVGPYNETWGDPSSYYEVWFRECKDLLTLGNTFISFHYYQNNAEAILTNQTTKETFIEQTVKITQHVLVLKKLCKDRLGFELPIAITEFNWINNIEKLHINGIYWDLEGDFLEKWTTAVMINMKDSGVWIALQWRLTDYPHKAGPGMIDIDENPKPQYNGFKNATNIVN